MTITQFTKNDKLWKNYYQRNRKRNYRILHKKAKERRYKELIDFEYERQVTYAKWKGSDYITCWRCKEEKHLRNFSEEHLVYYHKENNGWRPILTPVPRCGLCHIRDKEAFIAERKAKEIHEREMLKAYGKRKRSELRDGYIKELLKREGLTSDIISPELIELQRLTIKTKRELKKVKQ